MGKWTSNVPRLMARVKLVTGKKRITLDELEKEVRLSRPVLIYWRKGGSFTRPDGNAVAAWLDYFNRYFQCDDRDLLTFEMDTQPIKPIPPEDIEGSANPNLPLTIVGKAAARASE
jgi:transcriptional regulator with XRE-family HTH domain